MKKKAPKNLRLFWGALGFLSLVGAYFLFQDKIVDVNLRPLVERELAKAVNSPVSIKSIRGSLTGHIVLNDVDLTIPGEPWKSHLVVDQISVNLDLIGLIFRHKPFEDCFEKVLFTHPQITLIRSVDEPSTVISSVSAATPSANPLAEKIPLPIIPAGKLSIQNGVFSVQTEKFPKTLLRDVDFDAFTKNGKLWGVSLQALSPEANSKGGLDFQGSFNEDNLKILGKVSLTDWPLVSGSSAIKDLSGWELLDGTVDMESPLVFQPGRVWFDAATTLSNVSIKSPTPLGVTFSRINGRAFIRPTDLNVPSELTFVVGQTAWKASGLMPFDGRPMALRTSTDQLQLSDVFQSLLKLSDVKVDGTGTASFAATGPISNPSVEGTAQIGTSHIGNLQLDSFAVKAGYENGIFNLFDVAGKLYAGDFDANGFISLTGNADAPITLNAVLSNLDARQLALSFGVNGMDGQGNFEIHLGGSVGEPVLSADSQVTLDRTLQDKLVHYFVKTNLVLANQKLKFYGIFNDKTRLDGEVLEEGDNWIVNKLSLKTGKKITKLTGRGAWPKTDDKPIDLEITGTDVVLEDLPFLQDQFKDIRGNVDVDLSLSGTRKDPQASLQISSDEIRLGNLDPEPMDVSLTWKPGELSFEKMTVGDILEVTGHLGFDPDSPMDLKIKAKGVPIETISEISDWENPPEPFQGWITGELHIAGVRQNPIVEGSGTVDSVNVDNWTADQVDGNLSLENGKLEIKQLKLSQGTHYLLMTGSWDTLSKPGIMKLKLTADNFQLAGKPFLSGEFEWNAETGEEFWKDWHGTFSSADFSLGDGKNNAFHFTDFSIDASFANKQLLGKVNLGKNIYGSTNLDLSSDKPEIEAVLRIGPVLLSDSPNLIQFLPKSLHVGGLVSGELQLKKGTMDKLPMEGSFTVTDGSIQNYDFDRMEFSFFGNKQKVTPRFSLTKDEANYSLAGTMSSATAFWSPDSAVSINGPVKNEKLSSLFSLFGFQTDKQNVSGTVNGNLVLSGTLSNLSLGFSLTGENLQVDDNLIPSAELNFTETNGKISLGNNQINLEKGQISINQGSIGLDGTDPSLLDIDILGSAQGVQISSFNMSSQAHLIGKLSLDDKESRPTFDGTLSLADAENTSGAVSQKAKPFDLAISVDKKVITFKPLNTDQPQLLGTLDLSENKKVIFNNIHLENSKGTFSVDGTLDLNGQSKVVSDAKDIPIEEVGKWLIPNFPLSGNGNYHLIFQGGMDNPICTISVQVANGKAGALQFDLLSAELKSADNVLYLGSKEVPIELSKSGVFDFTLDGKMPLALTKDSWEKVQDNEMDINAQMTKGDFGIILLAGFAKKASGNMDLSAHVTGTLDNPVLNMDVDLSKCQFVPPMICQSVTDLNGHIKVRDNKLAIYGLNALIGKGRIFLSSPPVEVSKMTLVNFVPQYLDLNLQSIGQHGVWISVPTIMKKGQWGEVFFYGANPDLPLRIQGDISEPHVIGTAKMESGHYTFPPEEEKDDSGKSISFPALGRVFFELNLLAGSNCWYSNESYTQYLEVRVNPGDSIKLTGKDMDRTEDHPGIYSSGQAGTNQGYLRYLGHEFKVDEASLYIPHGKVPVIWGRATDTLQNVEIVTAGGVRTTNMDIWINFKGSFGNIDFTLDSSPHFTTNDPDLQQKLLLSYIMFGRDMTGYTSQQLQTVYQQNTGNVVPEAILQTIDRVASSKLTTLIRGPVQDALNVDVDFKSNILENVGTNGQSTPVADTVIAEPYGNTVVGNAVNVAKVEFSKPLDPRLTMRIDTGVQKNLTTGAAQGQFEAGLDYELRKNLMLDLMSGDNDNGQNETKLGLNYKAMLPDIMSAQKGDNQTPKYMKFDITEFGLGKYQLSWSTDLVTKSEVQIIDEDKNVVQDVVEKSQHAYDHQLVVDKLNPVEAYQVQIISKYLNGNEAVSIKTIDPQVPQ
jgi:hypothetical protein